MKKLYSIKLLLCALLLAIGCNAWGAEDDEVAKLDFTTHDIKSNSYTSEFTYGNWKIYGGSCNNNAKVQPNTSAWAFMRFGGKASTSGVKTDLTLYLKGTSPITKRIKEIKINHNGFGGKNATAVAAFNLVSIDVEVSSNSDFSSSTKTTFSSFSTFDNSSVNTGAGIEVLTPSQAWSANLYYKITLNCASTNTNNCGLDVYDIIFVEAGEGDTPTLTATGGDLSGDALTFSSIEKDQSADKTFNLSGANLTANASLAITGTNADMFSVSPVSVTPTDGTISSTSIIVTYAPTEPGDHSATLTISSTGATAKVISLSGSATAPATKYRIDCSRPVGGEYTVQIGETSPTTITEANSFEAAEGRVITMTSTAYSGYILASTPFTVTYDGGAITPSKSGTNYSFTMPAKAVAITANYSVTYSITAGLCSNGRITSITDNSGNVITRISKGSKVKVYAEADEHYHLTGMYYVKEGDDTHNSISATDDIYSFTMPQSNITIFATFEEDEKFIVNYFVNGVKASSQENVYAGTNLEFPNVEDLYGKVFRGWVDEVIEGVKEEEPDFVSTSSKVSESKDYYAVFATKSGEGDPNILKSVSGTITSGDYYIVDTYTKRTALEYWAAQGGVDSNNGVPAKMVGDANSSYISVDSETGQLTIDLTDVAEENKPSLYSFIISEGSVQISQGNNNIYGTFGSGVNANLAKEEGNNTINWKSISDNVSDNTHQHNISIVYNTSTRYLIYCDHTSSGASQNRFKNYQPTNMDAGGGERENSYGTGSFYFLQAGSDKYSDYCTSVGGTIDFKACDESGAYWATYSGAYNVVIPAEDENAVYNVYAVAYENEALVMFDFASDFNNVDAQSNPIVPANVGVLVKAVAKSEKTVSALTYTVSATAGENYDAEYNSLRAASVEKEASGYKFYMLARDANGENIGFYYGAADGGVFTSREGSAYLAVPKSASAPARFIFGQRGVPTDLLNVNDNNQSTKVLRDGRLYIIREGKTYDSFGRLVK